MAKKPTRSKEMLRLKRLAAVGEKMAQRAGDASSASWATKNVHIYQGIMADALRDRSKLIRSYIDERAKRPKQPKPADLRINRDGPKPKTAAEMAKPGPGVDNRIRAEKRKAPKSRSTLTPKGAKQDAAAAMAKVQAEAKEIVATEARIKKDAALRTDAMLPKAKAAKFDAARIGSPAAFGDSLNIDKNGTRLQIKVRGDTVSVNQLFSTDSARGKGQARELMTKLVSEADRSGMKIKLDADPSGGHMNGERLQKFYRSLGFKNDGGGDASFQRMARDPAKASAKPQTVKELKAAAKKAGIKGFSKMTKADLQAALQKGPAGWSESARDASAKARGVAKPGKAKAPKIDTSGVTTAHLKGAKGSDILWEQSRVGVNSGFGKPEMLAALEFRGDKATPTKQQIQAFQEVHGRKVKMPNGHVLQSTWYSNPAKTPGPFSTSRGPTEAGLKTYAGARLNPDQAAAKYNAWLKAGKPKKGPGALGIALGVGVGLYALSRGASTAEAAEASADVVTGGGISNYKANRKAGDSMAWAALKSGVQAVSDLASGFAVTHYQDARSRGVSQGKAVVSAAVGSANTMALGLPSAIGEMAASPESQKRRASMRGQFRQAGGYQAAAARLAMQRSTPQDAAQTADGWTQGYVSYRDGKRVKVDKYKTPRRRK